MYIGLGLPVAAIAHSSNEEGGTTAQPPEIAGLIGGVARVGVTLSATPAGGAWELNGVPIAGAVQDTYVVRPEDEGQMLSYKVEELSSAAAIVTYAPPMTVSDTALSWVANRPGQSFDAAALFEGDGLTYELIPDEAMGYDALSIDPVSGLLSGVAFEPVTGAELRVRAFNSGGDTETVITLDVLAGPNLTLEFNGDSLLTEWVSPLNSSDIDQQDITFVFRAYMTGLNYTDDQVVNLGLSTDSGFDVWCGFKHFEIRPGGVFPVRGISAQDIEDQPGGDVVPNVGWHTFAFRLYRRPERIGDGTNTRDFMLWRSDGLQIDMTANTFMDLSLLDRINIRDKFQGRLFDLAVMTGDPTDLLTAISANQTLLLQDYDFDADPSLQLHNHWPFYKEDPGAPLSITPFSINDDVDWLRDSVTSVSTWTTSKPPFWSATPPFLEPPLPLLDDDPALSLAGDVLTVDVGTAVGSPVPLLQGLPEVGRLLWNGVDVSAQVTDGQWTVPTGEYGQAVLIAEYTSDLGYAVRVKDIWIEQPTPLSGDDDAAVYMLEGVAKDGIYHQFASPSPVTRTVTEDVVIVGTTTVTSKTPSPQTLGSGRILNGAMQTVAVSKSPKNGWDSAYAVDYDPALNVIASGSVTLNASDCLVSACSDPLQTTSKRMVSRYTPLYTMPQTPKWDAFPPPYVNNLTGTYPKDMKRVGDIAQTLPALDTTGIPLPDMSNELERLTRARLDISTNWDRDWMQCSQHHGGVYGRDLVKDYRYILTYLVSDTGTADVNQRAANKYPGLIALVRQGIDAYHCWNSYYERTGEFPWSADGGHNLGRKALILFAGHMLDDADMLNVMSAADVEVRNQSFQEDLMTTYVTQENVDICTSGLDTDGGSWAPSYRWDDPAQTILQIDAYVSGMTAGSGRLAMPEWRGSELRINMNAYHEAHPYRISNNHEFHHATVLAMHALGLKSAWGHDAFFDYHYRHLAIRTGETDPWRFQGGSVSFYDEVEGRTGSASRYSADFDFQMLQRHFPLSSVAPWV